MAAGVSLAKVVAGLTPFGAPTDGAASAALKSSAALATTVAQAAIAGEASSPRGASPVGVAQGFKKLDGACSSYEVFCEALRDLEREVAPPDEKQCQDFWNALSKPIGTVESPLAGMPFCNPYKIIVSGKPEDCVVAGLLVQARLKLVQVARAWVVAQQGFVENPMNESLKLQLFAKTGELTIAQSEYARIRTLPVFQIVPQALAGGKSTGPGFAPLS